jgi:hypothetical protein
VTYSPGDDSHRLRIGAHLRSRERADTLPSERGPASKRDKVASRRVSTVALDLYLPILMLWRSVQESTFIDATVIGVHGDRELLYLETSDQEEALRVIPCPPKYERPRKGDRVKLELRLELRPDKRRRSWRTYIIRFPGDGLDREDIHDITDYDS